MGVEVCLADQACWVQVEEKSGVKNGILCGLRAECFKDYGKVLFS